jgi:hypothetical protein
MWRPCRWGTVSFEGNPTEALSFVGIDLRAALKEILAQVLEDRELRAQWRAIKDRPSNSRCVPAFWRALVQQAIRSSGSEGAEEAARAGTAHLQFLEDLIAGEAALHHDRSVARRIAAARFPVLKTLAGWNWDWPKKIDRPQIEHLLRLDFLDHHANVVFVGPTGAGIMPLPG